MKRWISKLLSYVFYRLRYWLKQAVDEANIDSLKLSKIELLARIPDLGKGVRLNGKVFISNPEMVVFGNNVHIGDNAFLYTDGGLIIGDNTHVSRNLTIYTSNHDYNGATLPFDENRIYRSVFIGANVWIGMNVNITPNVKIGEGAIIGMGATIAKDVPPYAIVAGPSYRFLKERDVISYKNLKFQNAFGGVNGSPQAYDALNLKAKSIFDLGDKLFFVVSTGRSGSQTIARVLSQHPNITCKHEAKGALIRLSTEYECGDITREEAKKRIIEIYSHNHNVYSEYYGESDQKIANLIDIYKEIFPKAKFIWLLRNAKDVISSTFGRGWFADQEFNLPVRESINVKEVFSGKIYSINRLCGGKISGQFSLEQWQKLSPMERNCWYWSYWNKKIEIQLDKLDKSDHVLVKLESLVKDIDLIKKLLNFTKFDFLVTQNNRAKYAKKEDWSNKDLLLVNRYCDGLMKKWYS